MSYQTLLDAVDTELRQMLVTDSRALICIVVSQSEGLTVSSTAPPIRSSSIVDRFAPLLDYGELLVEVLPTTYFVLLKSVSDSRVLLIARLLRNAYNNHEYAGSNGTLSFGCVLFNRSGYTGVELIRAAEKFALAAQGMKGGRILIRDLQCS